MKYALLVGDGMADYPVPELDGRTPLQAAEIPFMDEIARTGCSGLARTIPDGFAPGSDIGNLSLLGYDPVRHFTGRAPLEAVNLGISLGPDDVAFRCNIVTISDGTMADFSAGHVSTSEATQIIDSLNETMGDILTFHTGTSYRHVAVFNAKVIGSERLAAIENAQCTPPHDITGEPIASHLPKGVGAELLMEVMDRAATVLAHHPVTNQRRAADKHATNGIWLWGQGRVPRMPAFRELYGLHGAVISAVDLVKGIGKCAGLETIIVPGATGYFDTNYLGKAQYALDTLKTNDFVYVHVESPDEAGHEGLIEEKVRCIEQFDKLVVGPIYSELQKRGDFRVMTTCDHATPIVRRTHTMDMVPFAFAGTGTSPNGAVAFSESAADDTGCIVNEGYKLMSALINGTVLS